MNINQSIGLVQRFRSLDTDIQMSTAFVFLIIAQAGEEGITMTDIAKKADMGLSSVSRHVSALSKVNRHREEGFNLVVSHENPMERRQRIVTLTGKGKAFINNLLKE